MKKIIPILISLVSVLTMIGCAAQASAPTAAPQKIVIKYSSVLLPDMTGSVL